MTDETPEQRREREMLKKLIDPGRKNCQDDQEVVLTPGYKERENVEDWQYKSPEQIPKRHTDDSVKDSRHLEYVLAAGIGLTVLFFGLKYGCKRDDAYEKAKDKHIEETYDTKGLQKRIEEGRE